MLCDKNATFLGDLTKPLKARGNSVHYYNGRYQADRAFCPADKNRLTLRDLDKCLDKAFVIQKSTQAEVTCTK